MKRGKADAGVNGVKNFLCGSGWKMYLNCDETVEKIKKLQMNLSDFRDFNVVVFPSFPSLFEAGKALSRESRLKIGGQDMFWERKGPFTGEVSADMLLDTGCEYVEINHQERRRFCGETNVTANRKLKTAIASGLVPFLCVGEGRKDSDGMIFDSLKREMEDLLDGVRREEAKTIVFAYEPMWAIGKNEPADTVHIEKVHKMIRDIIRRIYDGEVSKAAYIIYGGGISMNSYLDIAALPDVNGLFTTGCGLDPDLFSEVIHRSAELLKTF